MQIRRLLSSLIMIVFLCGFTNDHTKVADFSQISNDVKIINAIKTMDGTSAEWAKDAILGNNLTNQPIKVKFENLSKLSPAFAHYDALGWMRKDKTLQIYINQKHRSAPPEAIASLLSHEAVHQDTYNSLEEETYAWTYEADVWHQMKKRNPSLNHVSANTYPLVDRLNILESKLVKGNFSSKYIRPLVYSNSGYQNLGKYSPGFTENHTKNAVWKKPVIGHRKNSQKTN